jgi:hypothetical protein
MGDIVASHSGDDTQLVAIVAHFRCAEDNPLEFAPRRQILSRDCFQPVLDLAPKVIRRLEVRNDVECPDLVEE